jgi:MerR family copper efflux transcriptional regulator
LVPEIPIACTLSAADKTARGDEWRQFIATNVTQILRSDTSVRMRLAGGDDLILTTVDLLQREKDCCAFFEFRLELLPDTLWLEVAVPAEAASMLDAFVATGAT